MWRNSCTHLEALEEQQSDQSLTLSKWSWKPSRKHDRKCHVGVCVGGYRTVCLLSISIHLVEGFIFSCITVQKLFKSGLGWFQGGMVEIPRHSYDSLWFRAWYVTVTVIDDISILQRFGSRRKVNSDYNALEDSLGKWFGWRLTAISSMSELHTLCFTVICPGLHHLLFK